MSEDSLFARAEAAISEARQLIDLNWEWQDRVREGVRQMYLKAIFEPHTLRVIYPQDMQGELPGQLGRQYRRFRPERMARKGKDGKGSLSE